MAPIIHCVRHAQGFHNLDPQNEQTLLDPELTPRGRDQCKRLAASFPHHSEIDYIISSPLRRTIQTTVLGFQPLVFDKGLKVLLEPRCQETTANAADTGRGNDSLTGEFGDILDFSRLEPGWNSNSGTWEMNAANVETHCTELKHYLGSLPYKNVLLVAHGSVSVSPPSRDSADHAQFLENFTSQGGWHNTEFRSYAISDGQLEETKASAELRISDPQGGFREDLGEPDENPIGV